MIDIKILIMTHEGLGSRLIFLFVLTMISDGEVRAKVFKGFQKAYHALYKFDSDIGQRLVIVSENDFAV